VCGVVVTQLVAQAGQGGVSRPRFRARHRDAPAGQRLLKFQARAWRFHCERGPYVRGSVRPPLKLHFGPAGRVCPALPVHCQTSVPTVKPLACRPWSPDTPYMPDESRPSPRDRRLSARRAVEKRARERRSAAHRPISQGRSTAPAESVRSWTDKITTFFTVISLPITAVASAYGVAYLIAPTLKPREVLGASITQVSIEQSVNHSEYMYRTTGSYADSQKYSTAPKGLAILVQASIIGFQDRRYSVGVQLLDSQTHARIDQFQETPKFTASTEFSECSDESPSAPQDNITFSCWSLEPRAGDRFIVRAELYDFGSKSDVATTGPGTLIAFLETSTFAAEDLMKVQKCSSMYMSEKSSQIPSATCAG
jgi:hypothetical protein